MRALVLLIQALREVVTRRRSISVVAIAVLHAMLAAAASAEPRAITLEEAVALAQKNALVVVQAEGQQRSSAADVRAAYASFLPSLSVSAGANRRLPSTGATTRLENGQFVTLTPDPWASNIGLSASVVLFDGGQRFFDLRQARARVEAAKANGVTQRFGAILTAKQAYFNVLAARESESAARAQLDQAEQQRRVAIARVKARNATRSDSLRAEIQWRGARLAVTQAANDLSSANAALARAVGSPEPVTAAEADSLGPPVLAVDDSTLRVLAMNGPAVSQAVATLSAARNAKKSSWTGYLPALSASYSRNGNGAGDPLSLGATDYDYAGALRLSLTLPIFNQLQRESQVVQADVAQDIAEASLRDARLAADQNFTQTLGAFRTAGEQVASDLATLDAAIEDLRVQQQRYAVGGSVLLDVLTSQTQLDQARRDLVRARYDQRVAKAQLEALVGREL
jgi:outer membrane protein